jgi:hypothetical protein
MLSHPVLYLSSYSVLSRPALPCPALPCPVLPSSLCSSRAAHRHLATVLVPCRVTRVRYYDASSAIQEASFGGSPRYRDSSFALAPGLHRDSSLRFNTIASHAKRSEDHSAQCCWEAVSVCRAFAERAHAAVPATSCGVIERGTRFYRGI